MMAPTYHARFLSIHADDREFSLDIGNSDGQQVVTVLRIMMAPKTVAELHELLGRAIDVYQKANGLISATSYSVVDEGGGN